MKKNHNFRKLNIWRDSIQLVKEVYTFAKLIDQSEKFGLINQMQRSSVSISSNIAEGSGRSSEKEFVRFLKMGLSSSYELETQAILVEELFQLDAKELLKKINDLQLKIGAFIRKLNSIQTYSK